MKRNHFLSYGLIVILVLSIETVCAFGQEVKTRHVLDNNLQSFYGLYNYRTDKWVTQPICQDGWDMGSIDGTYYHAMRMHNLYGVLDDAGNVIVNFQFEEIGNWLYNGFFAVKRSGSWGIADISNILIIPCEYESIYLSSSYATLTTWKEERIHLTMAELMEIRGEIIDNIKNEKEAKIIAAREATRREKNEVLLKSFSGYARAYMQPMVSQWARKGEFEKSADYEARVKGPEGRAFIDSLVEEARKSYIAEQTALFYESGSMHLGKYDPDREEYVIEIPRFGKITLNVPIAEGPEFKAQFDSMESEMTLCIANDKIALERMTIIDRSSGKRYSYENEGLAHAEDSYQGLKDLFFQADNLKNAIDLYEAKRLNGTWKSLNNRILDVPGLDGIANFNVTYTPDEQDFLKGSFTFITEFLKECKEEAGNLHYYYREVITSSGTYNYIDGNMIAVTDVSSIKVKVFDFKALDKYLSLSQKNALDQRKKYLETTLQKMRTESTIESPRMSSPMILVDEDTVIQILESEKKNFNSLTYKRAR